MSSPPTLRPVWPVNARVQVHATTRVGGFSTAPYDALNLGYSGGDSARSVMQNRQRLRTALALPDEPLWLEQHHGNTVVELTAQSSCHPTPRADGALTTSRGVVLAVLTADCLPVVVADRKGDQVAVVHAGWRGLATGILERTVERFAGYSELHAWLGPAIGPLRFEVGLDVRQAFLAAADGDFAQVDSAFSVHGRRGTFLADLYALAGLALNRQRAVTISGGEHCTFTDRERFYSYRRDGQRSGRMATLAWLK